MMHIKSWCGMNDMLMMLCLMRMLMHCFDKAKCMLNT